MDLLLSNVAPMQLCIHVGHSLRRAYPFLHTHRAKLRHSSLLHVFVDIAPGSSPLPWDMKRALPARLQSLGGRTEPTAVKTVPVQVAYELLNAGHLYLDVRTPEEFAAGHVHGAINVPYMYRKGAGMAKNHQFIQEVLLQFDKDDEILVGCQSGKRSQMAAAELIAMGFTGMTDIAGGYSTWVQCGLPLRSDP